MFRKLIYRTFRKIVLFVFQKLFKLGIPAGIAFHTFFCDVFQHQFWEVLTHIQDAIATVASQSAISLVIRTTGICWNQVVCERLAGNQRILLNIQINFIR